MPSLVVRFIRHGQSMCNLINELADAESRPLLDGEYSYCYEEGGGDPPLSDRGIEQAKALNTRMKEGTCKNFIRETPQEIEFETHIPRDFWGKFFLGRERMRPSLFKISKENEDTFFLVNTRIFVSSMKRAIHTASLAFENIDGCEFEVTDILREVSYVAEKERYKNTFVRMAKILLRIAEEGVTTQVALVCHHNTIRYMILAICQIFSNRPSELFFEPENAAYIDILFDTDPTRGLVVGLNYSNGIVGVAREVGESRQKAWGNTDSSTILSENDWKNVTIFAECKGYHHITNAESLVAIHMQKQVMNIFAIPKSRPDLQTFTKQRKVWEQNLSTLSDPIGIKFVEFILKDYSESEPEMAIHKCHYKAKDAKSSIKKTKWVPSVCNLLVRLKDPSLDYNYVFVYDEPLKLLINDVILGVKRVGIHVVLLSETRVYVPFPSSIADKLEEWVENDEKLSWYRSYPIVFAAGDGKGDENGVLHFDI